VRVARVAVRLAQLAQQLRVAEHLRLDPRGDAEEVVHRLDAAPAARDGEQLPRAGGAPHPRARERRGVRLERARRRLRHPRVQLAAVAGAEAEPLRPDAVGGRGAGGRPVERRQTLGRQVEALARGDVGVPVVDGDRDQHARPVGADDRRGGVTRTPAR
jgi:hypothetical protein